jgi:hypothetical protein
MKSLTYVLLIAALAVEPASAAVEQCRQIKVRADREACYDRQSQAAAEKRQGADKAADKANPDPADKLKAENDRVTKRLRGICRGC